MRSFEYHVTPSLAARDGRAAIPSMYGCAVKAAREMLSPSESWFLQRSTLEIDERPRLDDLFNIIVIISDNKNVTSINNLVLITNSEGEEIGRGSTDWIMADLGHIRPVPPERCIKEFCCRLPEEVVNGGLQTKIEFDCDAAAKPDGFVDYFVNKVYDDQFLFKVESGGKTICRATLQAS